MPRQAGPRQAEQVRAVLGLQQAALEVRQLARRGVVRCRWRAAAVLKAAVGSMGLCVYWCSRLLWCPWRGLCHAAGAADSVPEAGCLDMISPWHPFFSFSAVS